MEMSLVQACDAYLGLCLLGKLDHMLPPMGVHEPLTINSRQVSTCFIILDGTGDTLAPQAMQNAFWPLVPIWRSFWKQEASLDDGLTSAHCKSSL